MKFLRRWPKVVSLITALAVVAGMSSILSLEFGRIPHAKAAGAKMVLLWDSALSAVIPTGWSNASATYGGYFLRGDSVANVGTTNAGTHTHTQGTVAFSAANTPTVSPNNNKSDTVVSAVGHNHSILAFNMTAATILPVYRNLIAISYDAGIPTTLPQYAIALFDGSGASTGFTTYSSEDGNMVRVDSTSGGTGGATTHTHSGFSIISGTSDSNTLRKSGAGIIGVADHSHSYGGTSPASSDNTPLHTNAMLKYVTNSGGTAIPAGMIAMFDGDPGSNYNIISDAGGEAFYQVYLGANSTYATGQGSATHTHTLSVSSNSVAAGTLLSNSIPTATVIGSHSHTISGNFSTETNVVPYVNVVFGQKQAIYTPDTRQWRWYDAEDVADPTNTNGGETTVGNALGDENTAPASIRVVYLLNAIKLRIAVGETAGAGSTDVKYKLQYDTATDFASATDVAAQGGTGAIWRYYNGDNVTDDDAISNLRLSGPPSAGRHNEDASTGIGQGSTFDPSASTAYEHEFTIQNYSGANSTTYYFRLQYMENSTGAGGSWATVALNGSYSYPSLKTATTADLEVSQAPSDVVLGNYTLGGSGTLQYNLQAGEEIVFWDKRGTAAGYSVTASSLSLVCAACGPDTVPGTDITWTSTTGVLYGSFTSDATSMTGNTGQTLDATRNAYVAGSSADPTVRTGGFFFLPTLDFANLNSRVAGAYSGVLTITII